jgi:hypothetical protein
VPADPKRAVPLLLSDPRSEVRAGALATLSDLYVGCDDDGA